MKDHFQTDTVRTLVGGQTLTYVNECHLCPDLIFHIGWIGGSSWVTQPVAYQGETPVLLALAHSFPHGMEWSAPSLTACGICSKPGD